MSYRQLSIFDRTSIALNYQLGMSITAIGIQLGRNKSTISRELARNSKSGNYDAQVAHSLAVKRRSIASSRSRIDEQTKARAIHLLTEAIWTPKQISKRLKSEYGSSMSSESIYKMVHQDKKSGGKLYLNLKFGRKKRKRRFPRNERVKTSHKINIRERPEAANNRQRLGDFEGDTVVGKNHNGYLLTLVDRKSRYTKIKLMKNKTAEHTQDKIVEVVKEFEHSGFDNVFKTFTFDNGTEFSSHDSITEEVGVPIYFANPYSSYERGTNENTNGLIRHFFPKGTNFKEITQEDVDKVENLLNHRPREVLGFKTPYEVFFGVELRYCD